MCLISAEGCKNADGHILIIKKTDEIWSRMKDAGNGMVVKTYLNQFVKKYITYRKQKKPTKEQFKKYKITEREIYEKFSNLSKEELNTKSKENIYVRNDLLTTIIKRCRGEKKRSIRTIDRFIKKFMIPVSKVSKCPEFEETSKIGKLFMNEKILE